MRQERQASYSFRFLVCKYADSFFDFFWASSACDLVLGWPIYDEKIECVKFHTITY